MANKTRLKHAGRRGLSFFLALVMCISLVQITAFAAVETPAEEQARLQIEDDSGKLVYYTYDNGWGDPDSIPKNSQDYKVTNGAAKDAPDVKVSKKVTATGTENLFNVTLNVETTQKIKVSESSPDAAVVLLLDVTRSMGSDDFDDFKDNSDMTKAKKAAIEFVKNYAKDAKGARWLCVTSYGSTSRVDYNWVDLHAEPGKLNDVLGTIRGLTTISGTNTDVGLKQMETQWESEKISGITATNRFGILLTDGEPNQHTGDKLREEDGYVLPQNYNIHKNNLDYTNPARRAMKIRSDGTKLFSVYIGNDTTPKDWLKSFSDDAFSGNAQELNKYFNTFIDRIRLTVDAWKVTDPIPAENHMQFVGIADSSGTHAANAFDKVPEEGGSGELIWNLRNDLFGSNTKIKKANGEELTPKEYETYNEECTVSYQLTYQVRLNTAGNGFVPGQFVRTNGITKLDYYLQDNNGNYIYDNGTAVGDDESALLTLYFKVPAVKGYVGELQFKKAKYHAQDDPLGGAEFTLKEENNKVSDIVATSANGTGLVSFTKDTGKAIPSGFTYELSETEAPQRLRQDPDGDAHGQGQVRRRLCGRHEAGVFRG